MGAAHGFDPLVHISPTVEFPFGTPFTLQLTAGFVVPLTVAVKLCRVFTATVAVAGATFTPTLLVIVTVADAVAPPAVACTVTGFGAGTVSGAVYTAVVAPFAAIVPTVVLPPAIPFTSHVIPAPLAQIAAENPSIIPSPTLAVAGDSWLVAEHVIVTVALLDFAVSATLVAVTVTLAGVGTFAGAVYVALELPPLIPFDTIVPTVAFPPAAPFTLHVTFCDGAPDPVTVAVNPCAAFVATLAVVGAIETAMSSFSVTSAAPLAPGDASLTAVTVTSPPAGITPGAV